MGHDGDDLTEIVGEELNIVAFVMDYVELHFNGPKLTALTDPQVHLGTQTWTFPQPGSRDALCALIGLTVHAVSIEPDKHLHLGFGDAALTIPLDDGSRHGPEAAHFIRISRDGSPHLERMMIW